MTSVVPPTNVATLLRLCRVAMLGAGLLSGLVNILYLTGSFFMLEVYDRVLPSRSIPSLVALLGLALVLFAFQGLLETIRSRILSRLGGAVDETLGKMAFEAALRGPLKPSGGPDGLLPVRDIETIRGFLGGPGPSALFDMPWLPVYVAICYLFHPLIGLAALAGAVTLFVLTAVAHWSTSAETRSFAERGQARNRFADAGLRNAEVLAAMGMRGRYVRRWQQINDDYVRGQQKVSDVSGGFSAASKAFRMAFQSSVLALGAFLVIRGEATAGIIIASSILTSRALAPAELAIANWKGFVQALQSWKRVRALLKAAPDASLKRHTIPAPSLSLAADNLAIVPPGSQRPSVHSAGFNISAGQAMCVIGPSASGKSSLARALVGVWPVARGSVRLDGMTFDQWPDGELGRHVGYLPQEVELFEGTVADNIARFDPEPAGHVLAAAQAAAAHDMISRLPEGYDTRLGPGGSGLSAGQRQRIGLARALYRNPFLVVLDEPNANLDRVGEAALAQAIAGIRQRGGICVVVAHRPSALTATDMVLVMAEGKVQAFGPRDEILKRVLRPAPVPQVDAPMPSEADAS